MERESHFPADLARHVAQRFMAEYGYSPPVEVLVKLMETLYFASLKTDEGRPPVCTINFFDPHRTTFTTCEPAPADCWSEVRFELPAPLDIRNLTKLARAADPAVASLAVTYDDAGNLSICGLVDQELRYSDFIALDAAVAPPRPGLFQATITGVGNVSVYVNYRLISSLEQNSLVRDYHDVLWEGPVHDLLERHFRAFLIDEGFAAEGAAGPSNYSPFRACLQVRWINAICRILMSMQRYKHGGGLIISPTGSSSGLNVKYRIHYSRLPSALLGIDQYEFLRGQVVQQVAQVCQDRSRDVLPCSLHYQQREFRKRFDERKSEVLGCTHFIASLSCVDGFVLMDRRLRVLGFGVEVRSGEPVENLTLAGDPTGADQHRRRGDLEQFGTRHRAMIRYCHENPGALGFVVSQDGDIRAMLRLGDQLVMWENIEVQLAFRSESGVLIRHDGAAESAAAERAA
jgi:hypothetical protein